jgi:hypothetical protein
VLDQEPGNAKAPASTNADGGRRRRELGTRPRALVTAALCRWIVDGSALGFSSELWVCPTVEATLVVCSRSI